MKKSCKSAKQEHLKISKDFGKIKNEDSRCLIRLYGGINYVLGFQDILYRNKHLKWRKNGDLCIRMHPQTPRAWFMHPEHG